MAYTAFIKFSGIDGQSTDSQHPRWIDVLSFHWAASGVRKSWAEPDRQGRAEVNDFSIVKVVDKASPDLFTKSVNGDKIGEVKVEWVEKLPGKQNWQRKFMEYRFENAYISGIRPGGAGGSDKPLEEVSVNFETFTFKQG